jgi:hypothetical protein
LDVHDGEVAALGDLVKDSNMQSATHEGWFPHWLDGGGGSKSRTEVLLVLQIEHVRAN